MNALARTACVVAVLLVTSCSPFSSGGPTITVGMVGNGVGFVTSSPSGINCPGSCVMERSGSEVTLEGSEALSGTTFVGWSGACEGLEPCRIPPVDVFTSPRNTIAVAAFALRNSLVVSRMGLGTGTVRSSPEGIDCGEDCAELFSPQTEVTLTAEPGPGATFEGWSGTCSGAESCVVSAAQAQLVIAHFGRAKATLTVSTTGAGTGTIVSVPAGIDCGATCSASFDSGTQVRLVANPGPNSFFSGWSGACAGTFSCGPVINGATSVTARFEPLTTAPLAISPRTKTVSPGTSFIFTASGGVQPWVFSVTGGGAVTQAGVYTAPPTPVQQATVRVTDAVGATADAVVVVSAVLGILPQVKSLSPGEVFRFNALGGQPPYGFSITSGGGSIDYSQGLYTAPLQPGSAVVRVIDSAAATASATVTIIAAAIDAGRNDAGTDAGSFDAGLADAGLADAGPPDAGPAVVFTTSALAVPDPSDVVVGDWNKDGVADLAVVSAHANLVALRGMADGGFGAPLTLVVGTGASAVTSGDWNRDGNPDLAVANATSQNVSILLGLGDGSFLGAINIPANGAPLDVITGDWNRDGKADLALANGSLGGVSLILGRGDGTFLPASHALGAVTAFALATSDWNTDDIPDLAATTATGVSILLGAGDGTFGSPSDIPLGPVGPSVIAADLNSDGHGDLVLARASLGSVLVLLGRGDGTFPSSVAMAVGTTTTALVSGDWDGDGKPDLAVTDSASGTNSAVAVHFGAGALPTLAPVRQPVGAGPAAVAVGDWNRDGRPDLVVANSTGNSLTVLVNATPVRASPLTTVTTSVGTYASHVLAHDWNLDGKWDLAVASPSGVTVQYGAGDGTFTGADGISTSGVMAMVGGDWNRDGSPDLAVTNGQVQLLFGNVGGAILDGGSSAAGTTPTGLSSGDWNRDGRPDLATANLLSGDVSVLLGAGDGTFLSAVSYTAGTNPIALTTGDWNRDGRADLAVANQNGADVSVLLGTGNGTFLPAFSLPLTGGGNPNAITTGDWNRDGKPDLAVVESAFNGPGQVAILLGAGDGTFSLLTQLPVGTFPTRIITGDWNVDGHADLAVSNNGSHSLTVFYGASGAATCFGSPVSFVVPEVPGGLTSADFNGDGRPDIATGLPAISSVALLLSTP